MRWVIDKDWDFAQMKQVWNLPNLTSKPGWPQPDPTIIYICKNYVKITSMKAMSRRSRMNILSFLPRIEQLRHQRFLVCLCANICSSLALIIRIYLVWCSKPDSMLSNLLTASHQLCFRKWAITRNVEAVKTLSITCLQQWPLTCLKNCAQMRVLHSSSISKNWTAVRFLKLLSSWLSWRELMERWLNCTLLTGQAFRTVVTQISLIFRLSSKDGRWSEGRAPVEVVSTLIPLTYQIWL